jgi:hypothetical protein
MNSTALQDFRPLWRLLGAGLLALALIVAGGTTAVLAQEPPEKAEEEPEKPRTFTNKDLKRWKSGPREEPKPAGGGEETVDDPGQGDPSAEDEATDPETVTIDPWDNVGVATDSEGRGEAWWRDTMADARAALAGARSARDALQSEMNRRQADFSAMDDPAARGLVNQRIQELFTLLDEANQVIAEAEQAIVDLEREARRTGALPGWLR